ncbi:Vga family ABC-F type ribosomal protection protein [Cytobacillus horneckiae]|uniref:Vga family ABC-F type ribosomal protection protein n=1 Tax=Cytobacillus horneckiae TaxID=549687 RepID=A0A2N0ZJK4_9BACI|nr:Vga family ABC-F type ribosomal protection protein [Cytobacillus horneckiae]MEC1154049.1 Vga family ABC-F type ribosomal protection protein [Cytobacillus horneckiae]MED2938624.1 Vga family ABC-F type ribosomal protection protein [Cytobacillus horneckiae]PKG29673.1 Vga family ABC-F type ribosomal protection protein [Cytobacillus horneckiae]
MLLLEANELKIYIKDRLIADIAHLAIHKNERIGLVGRNGSGKTTLLEVLSNQRVPDEGNVVRHSVTELLPQLKHTDQYISGGELTQEYIKGAIARSPEILLADEPTTNLDTSHIEWMEKIMKGWQGAYVLVSHDRAFLDAVCTKIWEIEEGKLKEYSGNYSDYKAKKDQEAREQQLAYENYERKKAQLENALELKVKKAERATKKPKNVSASEASITGAKPYFAKKEKKLQKTAKSIETRLEKLEKVEKAKELPSIKMDLPNERTFKNRVIMRMTDLPGIIQERVLWKPATLHIKGGEKVAIVGPNGSGKTTLLKKIIRQDDGISISPAVKIGYFSQNIDILDKNKTILENVTSTSKQDETFIRTILARLRFLRKDVYKPVNVLSGGERVKVALAKLFVSDINTLILDEPTNFLDIEAVEALEELLIEYEGTIIFVSHDRRFIEKIANRLVIFEDGELTLFDGSYHDYLNYEPAPERDTKEDQLLIIETKITEVLSRLSIAPSEALEKEFQALLKRKRELQ